MASTDEEIINANKWKHAQVIRKNSKRVNQSREDRGMGKVKDKMDQGGKDKDEGYLSLEIYINLVVMRRYCRRRHRGMTLYDM